MDAFDSTGSPSQAHTPLPGGPSLDREAEIRLASYLSSVPYKCEDNDVMQQKLHFLVGRIILCAQSRDWKSLSTWIGVFQWSVLSIYRLGLLPKLGCSWLALKYPLPKSMRVNLVKLCFELVTVSFHVSSLRSWSLTSESTTNRCLGPT